jgi:hypothetical protein
MSHKAWGLPLKFLGLRLAFSSCENRLIEPCFSLLLGELGVSKDELNVANDRPKDWFKIAERLLDETQPKIEPVVDTLLDRICGNQVNDVD